MAPPKKKHQISKRKASSALPNGNEAGVMQMNALPLPPYYPPSWEEKASWPGFCEIENDPALFNTMLADWGVKGVRVHHVLSLDESLPEELSQQTYGLIFLFRYRANDGTQQETACPENVWFANQTHNFACATVSLLNVINNIDLTSTDDVQLGTQLKTFKEYTKDFTPALRGDAIANFDFVKSIHNSYSRKMDMLNIDLVIANEYADRNKRKAKNKTDEESAFHFNAFVPVMSDIWKLDGLDRQPQKIWSTADGEMTMKSGWLAAVKPFITAQMLECSEDGIEFGLLSVSADPLEQARRATRNNEALIHELQGQLNIGIPDHQTYIETDPEPPCSGSLGSSRQDMSEDESRVPFGARIPANELQGSELEMLRAGLLTQIQDHEWNSRNTTQLEVQAEVDRQKAEDRRHDYGPAIAVWLQMLAENGDWVQSVIDTTT